MESDDEFSIPTAPGGGASDFPMAGAGRITDSAAGALFGQARSPQPSRHAWEPPGVEQLQRMLPQYEILELAGHGGMGVVYKGWQRSLDRHVAIKVLPAAILAADPDFAVRFQREAKAMARLSHPGIVAVHDAGKTADDLLYFVMDFIEGTDVHQLIAQRGRLPVHEALAIISNVCAALAYAHAKGIVHRDIKPSNIMVDTDGSVKVADFGLAKVTTAESALLTASNVTMGTPDFMAPESLLGTAHVDHRADLYAVGVMLYQMLTGKLPRGRFDPPSRALPGLDKRLDRIVDRALQPDRDARYPSALALRSALDPVLTRSMTKRVAATDKAKCPGRKSLIVGAVAVAVIGAGAFFVLKKPQPSPPAAAAPLADVNIPRPLAPLAASIEARAVRLWDTPQKITGTEAGVRWENEALRLDQRSVGPPKLSVRDLILRASVLANPDAVSTKLYLRIPPGHPGNDISYVLGINASTGVLRVNAHITGKFWELATYQLPRPYGPTEWIRMEFRAVGDELTVIADEQVLGRVRDGTLSQRGSFEIYAEARGYFRDISYIPLDGLPEAEALRLVGIQEPAIVGHAPEPVLDANGQTSYPAGVWTRLWTAAEEAKLAAEKDGDWLLLNNKSVGAPHRFTNVGVRARFRGRRTREDNFPQLNLRSNGTTSLNLFVDATGRKLQIREPGPAILAEIGLQDRLRPAPKEYAMEFYAIGSVLAGRVNGETVTAKLTQPLVSGTGVNLYYADGDFVRDVEVLNLDGVPEAEAWKLIGIEKP